MSESLPVRLLFHAAASVVRPAINLAYSKRWTGVDNLPMGRGFILAANHISQVDPLAVGHMLYDQGYIPHFMAKKELFEITGLGPVLTAMRQIPVDRGQGAPSLEAATEVINDGGVVILYPEGTITRDPEGWPMLGKTGVARLALRTGAPVVPVGQWGLHKFLPRTAKTPTFTPRTIHQISVAPVLDLDDLREKPMTGSVLHEATDRMMRAITQRVAVLRGMNPPAEGFYDPETGTRTESHGNRH